MFLDGLSAAGLDAQPRTDILLGFPLLCRQAMCRQVLPFFCENSGALDRVLPTDAHVRWAMEIVGAAFRLPLADHFFISQAISIYEAWLGLGKRARGAADAGIEQQQPAAVRVDEERFQQAIVDHMSLLFEVDKRESYSASVSAKERDALHQKQRELCSRVLGIWCSLGRHATLSRATWVRLVRVATGTTDRLLRQASGPAGVARDLAKELCPESTRTLLELCLRSLPHVGEERAPLWKLLCTRATQWAQWATSDSACAQLVIVQWRQVSLSLTTAVARWLDSTSGSTRGVRPGRSQPHARSAACELRVEWAGEGRHETKLQLPVELTCYAWQRCLHLIGNPNALHDPTAHATALEGLQALTLELLDPRVTSAELVPSAAPSSAAPSVNALLRLVGPWFFDAALSRTEGLERGRATALGTLCRVVARASNSVSEPPYWAHISRLFLALKRGLEDAGAAPGGCISTAITMDAADLCSCRFLPGCFELLYPRLVGNAIAKLHAMQDSRLQRSPELTRACLRVLGSHVMLPRQFVGRTALGGSSISKSRQRGQADDTATLLCETLKATDPANQQTIVWLLVAMCVADDCTPQTAFTVLNAIATSLLDSSNQGGLGAAQDITKLQALATLADFMPRIAGSGVGDAARARRDDISRVISHVVQLRRQGHHPEHVALHLGALGEWIDVHPWLLQNKQVYKKLVNEAVRGQASDHELAKSIAQQLFDQLLCQVGRLPASDGSGAVCIVEADVETSKSNAHWYLCLDGRLLSFVEAGEYTTVIVRSAHTHRAAWRIRNLNGGESSSIAPAAKRQGVGGRTSTTSAVAQHGEKRPEATPAHEDPLLRLAAAAPQMMTDWRSEPSIDEMDQPGAGAGHDAQPMQEGDPRILQCQPPSLVSESTVGLHVRLLSHAGLLNTSTWGQLFKLDGSPQMRSVVRSLDRQPCREQHACRVEFAVSSAATQGGGMAGACASSEAEASQCCDFDAFQRFCLSLATLVDLATHVGFAGGAGGSEGQGLYHSTLQEEVFFHVAALPHAPGTSMAASRAQTLVVFVSNDCEVEPPPSFWRHVCHADPSGPVIVIEPRQNRLFRVRMEWGSAASGENVVGPLLDGMIVSERQLGTLCRRTIVNFHRQSLAMQRALRPAHPSDARRDLLHQIARRFSDCSAPADFWKAIWQPH